MKRDPLDVGWRVFEDWRKRFWDTRDPETENHLDYLYLLGPASTYFGQINPPSIRAKVRKLAFLEHYLAIESGRCVDVGEQARVRAFPGYVRAVLRNLSKRKAPAAYGFWLYDDKTHGEIDNADPADTDLPFVSVFFDDPDELDLGVAAMCAPVDHVMIRRPEGKWTMREGRALAARQSSLLERTGFNAEFVPRTDGHYLFLEFKIDPSYETAHNWRIEALDALAVRLHVRRP
ncbi:MAG: hypothetical protein WDM79_02015 [Terricaulis sp.]